MIKKLQIYPITITDEDGEEVNAFRERDVLNLLSEIVGESVKNVKRTQYTYDIEIALGVNKIEQSEG